jgi:hypothetical protein
LHEAVQAQQLDRRFFAAAAVGVAVAGVVEVFF